MNNINSFTPLNYLINQENFAVTRHWSPLSAPSSSVAPKFITIIDPSSAPRPSVFLSALKWEAAKSILTGHDGPVLGNHLWRIRIFRSAMMTINTSMFPLYYFLDSLKPFCLSPNLSPWQHHPISEQLQIYYTKEHTSHHGVAPNQ